MPRWTPDQPLPVADDGDAVSSETLAYVAMIDPTRTVPDAIGVVDVDPASRSAGRVAGRLDLPNVGDELHHFGWNACSSCLCPIRRTRTWSAAI